MEGKINFLAVLLVEKGVAGLITKVARSVVVYLYFFTCCSFVVGVVNIRETVARKQFEV